MIKIRLSQLVDASAALSRLGAREPKAIVALHIKKVLRLSQIELADYDAVRKPLLAKYGILSVDGTHYDFETPEKAAALNAEMRPVLDAEIELDVKPLLFAEIEGMSISGSDLLLLDWLVEEPIDG